MAEYCFDLIQHYGYLLLFIIMLAGMVGFPIPDEGILLFTGALMAKGAFELFPAFLCTSVAALAGSLINYSIAQFFGGRKLARWGKKMGIPIRKLKRSIRIIHKYGIWAIPISYFVPGVRLSASYGAGLLQFYLRDYTISSVLGIVIWVSFYLWIGYMTSHVL